ncbi:MAG: hypothetical protein AAF630_17465 [Cyanobacteria bacterium P01_C01_bin.38]
MIAFIGYRHRHSNGNNGGRESTPHFASPTITNYPLPTTNYPLPIGK